MSFRVVGKIPFADDPMNAWVEVCTWNKQADGIRGGVIFLTKFRSGQIGERSVGMSVDVARKAAALLTTAAEHIEATNNMQEKR